LPKTRRASSFAAPQLSVVLALSMSMSSRRSLRRSMGPQFTDHGHDPPAAVAVTVNETSAGAAMAADRSAAVSVARAQVAGDSLALEAADDDGGGGGVVAAAAEA